MAENTTPQDGGSASVPIAENKNVKELFAILQEHGKDSSGLAALIHYVSVMENYVQQSENTITEMKTQFDSMREAQNHPVKTASQKAIRMLETKVAEIKDQLSELKSNIIDGCKNAAEAFTEKGAAVLDKLASFFHIKGGLQAIKNNAAKSVDACDKAVGQIETCSSEYHTAGRALKNIARVMVGKKPMKTRKKAGKLAKATALPFHKYAVCMRGICESADKLITSLDKLEQDVTAKQAERAAKPKKKLIERLEEKKEEIKAREIKKPSPKRGAKAAGLEV